MKPPFTYYGGKVGLASRILELIPPHRIYLEPFFGSGAVLFAKEPSTHEIINDLDGDVINFFRILRDRPDDLEMAVRLTPYARDEWLDADLGAEGLDDLERARRFWVRVNQSFAKTHNTHTGWSITTARTQAPPRSVLGRIGRFAAVAERLMEVTIENTDGIALVERFGDDPDAVIYADPPYVGSSRRGGRDRGEVNDYTIEMPDDEHRRLAKTLASVDATVILSGYPTPLYEEIYEGWWTVDYTTNVHASNSVTSSRDARVERLWMNRAPAHTLFSEM